MTHISHLSLTSFRSYETLRLNDCNDRAVILCGANGAGKTNILEAISMLSPGRGLRGAKLPDIQNSQLKNDQGWVVAADLGTGYGPVKLGVGLDATTNKKLIRINGAAAKSQGALGEWLTCLWLTPQMDRLFIDSASQRRRFFDRLVYNFDPAHLGRLTRYENAMRQRLKLLKEGNGTDVWLEGLERQMAETGISIAAARYSFTEKLQRAYESATQEEQNHFPQASLTISGTLESQLDTETALDIEENFVRRLYASRRYDGEMGVTSAGPHKSDFLVRYTAKNMPAADCSTGEQKALLIGIILAHARLLSRERGAAPVLLLDEIVAHLDPNRRAVLADILSRHGSQIWMSGTDPALFSDFTAYASVLTVESSEVIGASP